MRVPAVGTSKEKLLEGKLLLLITLYQLPLFGETIFYTDELAYTKVRAAIDREVNYSSEKCMSCASGKIVGVSIRSRQFV